MWRRNPWHPPRVLRGITWAYLAWSFLPALLAIRASFTARPLANGAPSGWSLDPYRWTLANPDTLTMLGRSFTLAVLTVLLAVPMGTGAAIFLGRRSDRSTLSLAALVLVAIAVPQLLLAANLLSLAVALDIRVGWWTQLIGHVTVALPFVVLIVLVGVRGVRAEQVESAMDLGAGPIEAIRRVVLPIMVPALVAATSVAFVLSYDNFVMSQMLCIETARCETVPMSLFGRGGIANPGAASYALATMALAGSLAVVALAAWAWSYARRRTRR